MLIDINIFIENDLIELELNYIDNYNYKIYELNNSNELINTLKILNYYHDINNINLINTVYSENKIKKIINIIQNELNLNVNY